MRVGRLKKFNGLPIGGAADHRNVGANTANNTTTWVTCGSFAQTWVNPAAFTTWKFYSILSAPLGFTCEVRLYDFTSATTIATLSTSATVPTYQTSSALTIPVDNSTHVYLTQVRIASGSPGAGDIANCLSAFISLE